MKNIKRDIKMDPAMKLNGGFELTDLERAKTELKETQMKLSGRYIPPEERGDMFSKEDALAQLHETLSGNTTKETEAELERLKMKLNSKPKSLKEARAQLKRTQAQ